MPHQRVIIVVATVTLAVAALLTGGLRLLADAQAAGNIPEMMSYQGYATDSGGTALNGTYAMTFAIYDSSSDGTKYWEETHAGVTVNSGYFAVMLGSQGTPLAPSVFDGANRYLQVTIGSDPPLPRQRIGAVPYALQAYTARTAVEATQAMTATYAMTATVALNAGSGGNYANVIVVAKSGGDYTSVAAALASISDSSSSNRYLVYVAPGTYTETSLVDVKPYVHLQGAGQNVTVVTSARSGIASGVLDGATVRMRDNAQVSDITILNEATTNDVAVGVYMENVSHGALLKDTTVKTLGTVANLNTAIYLLEAEPSIRGSWLQGTGTAPNLVGISSENGENGFPRARIDDSTILAGNDSTESCAVPTGTALSLFESSPTINNSHICGGARAVFLGISGFPAIHHSTVRVSTGFNAALTETPASGIVSIATSRVDNFNDAFEGTPPRCAYTYSLNYDTLDQNCSNGPVAQ
ncbi:MAG: hypothetical protein H6644_19885 [Caldilineaceae bacterium]|nr:hypothetical protein [Caldilineaceae bacterium]